MEKLIIELDGKSKILTIVGVTNGQGRILIEGSVRTNPLCHDLAKAMEDVVNTALKNTDIYFEGMQ